MKLFVRATESEVASIRTMIERLEAENTTTQEGNIRILPFSGQSAEDALERAGRFWTGENKIHWSPQVIEVNRTYKNERRKSRRNRRVLQRQMRQR